MDNITHTLAALLLAEMGLRRRSRFAFAACLLGANAPDIDVFAPLAFRSTGSNSTAARFTGSSPGRFSPLRSSSSCGWSIDGSRAVLTRFRSGPPPCSLSRSSPSSLTISRLADDLRDCVTGTVNWKWSSGDAIFIVDWVYWLLMIGGVAWSARRWRRAAPNPGRPAQIAGALMLGYIAFNLGESARLESATTAILRARGIEPTLVVCQPAAARFLGADNSMEKRRPLRQRHF